MTALVMMYLYYDKIGNIKAITPDLDDGFGNLYAMFSLAELEPFLAGKMNPADFKVEGKDSSKKLIKKISHSLNVNRPVRLLKTFLTKVSDSEPEGTITNSVTITNKISEKIISVSLAELVKELYNYGDTKEKEYVDNFLQSGEGVIYITKKDNPHFLLHTLKFSIEDLFDNMVLNFKYDGDFENCSAYTKQIIDGYRYIERN